MKLSSVHRITLVIFILFLAACGTSIPANPTQGLLDCLDTQHRELTRAQWDIYLDDARTQLEGATIHGNGIVKNVDDQIVGDGYAIFLDVGARSGDVILLHVPESIALSLSKGDAIAFSGSIRGLGTFPGFFLSIDNAVIEIQRV
jgi:hypothetical protein